MVSGLQYDSSGSKLKLLELERAVSLSFMIPPVKKIQSIQSMFIPVFSWLWPIPHILPGSGSMFRSSVRCYSHFKFQFNFQLSSPLSPSGFGTIQYFSMVNPTNLPIVFFFSISTERRSRETIGKSSTYKFKSENAWACSSLSLSLPV